MNLLAISRPRFWLYLLGPYLIGLAALHDQIGIGWWVWVMGLYFTFPANLLIYGINDIFDIDTDKHNPKKQGYEALLDPAKRRIIAAIIVLINLPFIIFGVLAAGSPAALLALVGFLFFGIFYSAPPIRAKAEPGLDSAFNILYVFPGIYAYTLLKAEYPSVTIILAATFWCMAMHAFSAIPDIAADKKAGVTTIATRLGAKGTLLFCSLCYGLAGLQAWPFLGWFVLPATAVYMGLMLWSAKLLEQQSIFRLYKWFPYINLATGVSLFCWIIFAT